MSTTEQFEDKCKHLQHAIYALHVFIYGPGTAHLRAIKSLLCCIPAAQQLLYAWRYPQLCTSTICRHACHVVALVKGRPTGQQMLPACHFPQSSLCIRKESGCERNSKAHESGVLNAMIAEKSNPCRAVPCNSIHVISWQCHMASSLARHVIII